jgi:hypothetical protein
MRTIEGFQRGATVATPSTRAPAASRQSLSDWRTPASSSMTNAAHEAFVIGTAPVTSSCAACFRAPDWFAWAKRRPTSPQSAGWGSSGDPQNAATLNVRVRADGLEERIALATTCRQPRSRSASVAGVGAWRRLDDVLQLLSESDIIRVGAAHTALAR